MNQLLSREEFKTEVFRRDRDKCVFCGQMAVDAHHLLERKLFSSPDEAGGYFLNNGIAVCAACHQRCEATEITPQAGREAAGIREIILPHCLEDEAEPENLTKWGDLLLPDGTRQPGPMFFEPQVQNFLRVAGLLEFYRFRYKYPRTPHVPFSQGRGDDDRVLNNLDHFVGRQVVVTEKRDGGNLSGYADGFIHARSIDGMPHRFETRARASLAAVLPNLPEGWRLCGENLQAQHSIAYQHLGSFVEIFSLWDERNNCLDWDETVEWASLLGLSTVPVLYEGIFDENILHTLWQSQHENGDEMEGWVMRTREGFAYRDFGRHVAKFVRASHVRTTDHWTKGEMIENKVG